MTITAAAAEVVVEVVADERSTSDEDHYPGTSQEDAKIHLPQQHPPQSVNPSPSDANVTAVQQAVRMQVRLMVNHPVVVTQSLLWTIGLCLEKTNQISKCFMLGPCMNIRHRLLEIRGHTGRSYVSHLRSVYYVGTAPTRPMLRP